MVVMSPSRAGKAPSRRARARRTRFASLQSFFQFGRRAWWVLLAMPLALRILVIAVVILAVWSAVNWTYQVLRKPTELFFPVSGALLKTPPETWRQYRPLFRGHSTAVMTPDPLALPAQASSPGNPVART